MDGARHDIRRILNRLMNSARHVRGCDRTQETRLKSTCDDVASTVHQSLRRGGGDGEGEDVFLGRDGGAGRHSHSSGVSGHASGHTSGVEELLGTVDEGSSGKGHVNIHASGVEATLLSGNSSGGGHAAGVEEVTVTGASPGLGRGNGRSRSCSSRYAR